MAKHHVALPSWLASEAVPGCSRMGTGPCTVQPVVWGWASTMGRILGQNPVVLVNTHSASTRVAGQ